LARRKLEPEIMDDPSLDADAHRQALRGLARLNIIGGAAGMLWPAIAEEIRRSGGKTVTVLDLACGDGGFLRAIGKRAGNSVRLVGADISETALAHAAALSPASIRYVRADVLSLSREDVSSPDIVTCSLFAHHLSEPDQLRLFEAMKRLALRRALLNDLERSWVAWWGVWMAARLVSQSRVVHVDSARSVAAALTRDELGRLAERVGMTHARIDRRFPFRLVLDWSPTRCA